MPTVYTFPLVDAQYFDNSGEPLAGGKLFFYAAPSFSTLKTTYSDSGGTTPNTNPIVLDSSGRPPTNIWVTSGDYNVTLTMPDGTTVLNTWTTAQGAGGTGSNPGGGGGGGGGGPTTIPVPISEGGTGEITAQEAIDALLPPQAGNAGKYLTTDGVNAQWGPTGQCNFDANYQNVALLLDCSDLVGNTQLLDSSYWGEDVALPGQWEYSATTTKFGTTSLLVKEGVGPFWEDYRFTRHAGSGYTVEMWFRPDVRDAILNQAPNLFRLYDVASATTQVEVSVYRNENRLLALFEGDVGGTTYAYSPLSGGWNHMAVVFQTDDSISLYINGLRVLNRPSSSGIIAGALNEEWGFHLVTTDQLSNQYTCYLDGVRVSNGIARYTGSSYTLPTGPFGNSVTNGDPLWNDVTLLAHFDGDNFDNTTVDSSQYNNSMIMSGGAYLSTTQQEFGPSSLFADSGGSVFAFNNPGFSGDFVIDCWVYKPDASWISDKSWPIASTQAGTTFPAKNFAFQIYTTSAGVSILQLNTWDPNSSPPNYDWTNYRSDPNINLFTTQTWHAVVVQRRSGRLQGFVDGILVIDVAMADDIQASSDVWDIGRCVFNPTGEQTFNGYIDEFRITRGVARYYDLVAPLGPFPLVGCQGGTGLVTSVDVSGGTTGLTTTGGPVIDSGTITLGGILNIANGGTGADTASAAINALVPNQAAQGGNFLTTNGTSVSWAPIGGGGGVTQIVAGTNVSISPSGGTGTVTINSSAGLGSGTVSSVVVPNNALTAPITHGLGRIPLIMLWINSADFGNVVSPYLADVTTTTFVIGANGTGGTVWYSIW